MNVCIIGAGMGSAEYLTLAARKKIENADIIIGAKRVTEPYSRGKETHFEYEADKIMRIINGAGDKNIAVLFSGDASFFSGAARLAELCSDAEIEPGISSASYFCAKIGVSMDDMNVVSLHGRKCNIVSETRRNKKTFALLGENPCGKLCEYGLGGARVYIGENLSYENEKIYHGTAEDFKNALLPPLSVIAIINENASPRVRSGIDDGEFITGGVPMTKSAVRAVTAARLEIEPDSVVCDIGAGTGTVSVEAALAAYKGTVYAIEKNHEAAELIRANAVKFMCDNIVVIEGAAPDTLDGLPKPDRVFIGGSSGTLKQTIEKCNCGRIVVNAVTVETLTGTLKSFEELDYEYDIEQINASYARKIGGYNMLTAHNGVFVISGRRKAE